MPLPPESLAKALELHRRETVAGLLRRGDHLFPADALPGIEIEHDAVAGFERAEPRAAGVNLERAGLHQFDQIVELLHRDHVVLLGIDDMAQRGLLHVRGDVLLKETFAGGASRTAYDGKRPVDDMRRHVSPRRRHNIRRGPPW